jgi:uncharacterized protein
MPHKPKALVLDSYAVLAYLADEPAGAQVEDLIVHAHEDGTPISMSVVNVGEVWYILAREISNAEADKSVDELRNMGIVFVDADWNLALGAARVKAHHKMSFADCFAASLAKESQAELVTGDQEFKQIQDMITIHWV